MQLTHYRYGTAREGPTLSIGVARYSPRGVAREDWRRLGYFDVWMPMLAPSRPLLAAFRKCECDFTAFAARYRKEMKASSQQQAIRLLAAVAQTIPVELGCFCEDASRCHRSLLAELIVSLAEQSPAVSKPLRPFASPPCSMPEIED